MLRGAIDGFFVGHLGCALIYFHLELALQSVDEDIEVKLTHSGNNRLAGVVVRLDTERGVLFGQLTQSYTQLVHVGLCFWLNSQADNRLGEIHRLQYDRVLLVAKRIAGFDVFKANHGSDVAGTDIRNRVLLVGVHLEDPGNPLFVVRPRVEHVGARLQITRIYADKAKTTNKWVSCDLK